MMYCLDISREERGAFRKSETTDGAAQRADFWRAIPESPCGGMRN